MSVTFTVATRMDDGSWWHGHHDAAFNVANGTARAIMDAIGIPFDYCGSHDAADVHARCVAFRAAGDAQAHAVEGFVERGGGATMIECGISAERIERNVARMEEVARCAMAVPGAEVGWS